MEPGPCPCMLPCTRATGLAHWANRDLLLVDVQVKCRHAAAASRAAERGDSQQLGKPDHYSVIQLMQQMLEWHARVQLAVWHRELCNKQRYRTREEAHFGPLRTLNWSEKSCN